MTVQPIVMEMESVSLGIVIVSQDSLDRTALEVKLFCDCDCFREVIHFPNVVTL